ncbi:hypothetical protein GCM10010168_84170 [Actinoplanes ianthinogenes]|uniref:Cyclic nucleotide-binding domain-containing protein n=1 Tax=Actinoplanes ianthinogenes TaxID=122358 RepID=A0ABM7M0E0_9ACTN|nr:hypothetical protein [Actinoplanes ianthinogenes]BCJ45009.1 hypothetical protein Aiant_56660 [Actinoplanes ianthinogenes]GGR52423.1 hypothetical protein GCM10010168_84170 [Actinoplanes ianthinogenes]
MIPGSPATATVRRLLAELGESGSTGALHVGGTPGGVFYLVAGRIAYAESPAAPSLAERLIGSGRISPAIWRAAYAEGRHGCRVGRVLLRDGWLGQHELALRVVAAIAGATHALLRQADAPARFVPGERHWLGEVTPPRAGARPRLIPRRRRARHRIPATGP